MQGPREAAEGFREGHTHTEHPYRLQQLATAHWGGPAMQAAYPLTCGSQRILAEVLSTDTRAQAHSSVWPQRLHSGRHSFHAQHPLQFMTRRRKPKMCLTRCRGGQGAANQLPQSIQLQTGQSTASLLLHPQTPRLKSFPFLCLPLRFHLT